MLSDTAIDNLVQQIVNRQEAINIYVLTKIANRLRKIGELSPNDIRRMQVLVQSGTDIRQMNDYLAEMSGKQVRDIKSIIKTVALDNYLDAKPLYDYRHKPFIPFEQNTELQRITDAIAEQTTNTYENLSNSNATGFWVKDVRNPQQLIFRSIDASYRDAVDKAIQAVLIGAVDKEEAIRGIVKQLLDSGIRRLYWESGYSQRLDTAVRRNVQDGVKQINQRIQDAIGRQVGADGKELSVHANSAPDHEPFQGHQFTNEEYENLQSSEDFRDVDGQLFTGVKRIIGEWNCRHFAYSIIVGQSKPRYSKQQLQNMIRKNHEGYMNADGKHFTLYECTQVQRKLETKIRYAKEEQMLMKELGNNPARNLARRRVEHLTAEYKRFSKQCNMPMRINRTTVPGYKSW